MEGWTSDGHEKTSDSYFPNHDREEERSANLAHFHSGIVGGTCEVGEGVSKGGELVGCCAP